MWKSPPDLNWDNPNLSHCTHVCTQVLSCISNFRPSHLCIFANEKTWPGILCICMYACDHLQNYITLKNWVWSLHIKYMGFLESYHSTLAMLLWDLMLLGCLEVNLCRYDCYIFRVVIYWSHGSLVSNSIIGIESYITTGYWLQTLRTNKMHYFL